MHARQELSAIASAMGLNDDYALLVGPAIQVARKEAGMTQKELAVAIGCSGNAVCRFESGIDVPPGGTIDAILNATGVSVVRSSVT